jgi:hypothetical protein
VKAVNHTRHVFLVINISCLGNKNLRKADVVECIEKVIDIVGVSELQAHGLKLRLIFVVNLLERDLLWTEKVGKFGQVDSVADYFFAFASRR